MVKVGPWTVESVMRNEIGQRCERCRTPIKEIWICTVDADSDQLVALKGQRTWQVGCECGPTLWALSEREWRNATAPIKSRLKLAMRTIRVLDAGAAEEYSKPILEERLPKLLDGTLEERSKKQLGYIVTRQERILGFRG